MSKTSIKERNKAIRLAWEREQKLVAEGKGTRDWSQDQQKDILDPVKGKAYDENGRAFEGQHMKSAAEYPEYQGDPDNIQFLTREEHLEAHKGSWKNSTNWYYHPETKEFVDFGENKPIPCEANYLSEPVCSPVINSHYKNDNLKEPSKAEAESRERVKPLRQEDAAHHLETKSQSKTMVPTPEVHESFVDKVLRAVDAAKEFSERHAVKTAEVLNYLSPVRVLASGLSIFPDTPLMEEVRRGEFVEATETEKIQELYTFVKTLDIHTLLDATNVSNMMPVYGHLPEDKEKILAMLKQGADEQGEERLRMRRDSMRSL